MLLKNDADGLMHLYEEIIFYYKQNGSRSLLIFDDKYPGEDGRIYVRFLLCKKHVIEYAISEDRGLILGALSLAIGPHYFGVADFWSYADSQRFKLSTELDDIEHNLRLLDEFLGYPVKHPHIAP